MKNLILVTLVGLIVGSEAAHALGAPIWIITKENRVYYAPNATVTVRLQELKADEDYWDRLQVSLGYSARDIERQASEIRGGHPGREVVRMPLQQGGKLRVQIPVLGVDEEAEAKLSPEGPVFHLDYFVKKKDSARVRGAVNGPGFLNVSGTVTAPAPTMLLEERAELPGTICRDVFGAGGDMFGVIRAYGAFEEKLLAAAKTEHNRDFLRTHVLSACLELPKVTKIDSFREMLGLEVKTRVTDGNFVSESYVVGRRNELIPLQYSVQVEP